MSRRWLQVLVGALVVDGIFALVTRLDELDRLMHGDRSFSTLFSVAGLGWLLVVFIAVGGVSRSMYTARRRLVASEGTLDSVASTSRDWLWEADNELRLTYCSPRVSEQLGYTPQELLGRALPTLLTGDDEPRARQILAHAVSTKSGWNDVELRWQHSGGHAVTLQGSAAPIFNHTGAVVGFRGTRRTVTEAMTAERSIVAARARITDVLNEGAVDTALQPIVDVATGRLRGAEALARFRDGRGPVTWFADARETGQGLELDRLAFTSALCTLPALPPDAYLSINATPELITDPQWQQMLAAGDLPLERLVVEITEHVEIGRYDDIHAALLPLRERGLRLAIDDTGAGYASFSHVLQLRPDIIKIDRSLVTNIAEDLARRSLVTALMLLALDLNATLTAEGVETVPELTVIATLGVDNAQGYLLGRPTIDQRRWRSWHNRTWHCIATREHAGTLTHNLGPPPKPRPATPRAHPAGVAVLP